MADSTEPLVIQTTYLGDNLVTIGLIDDTLLELEFSNGSGQSITVKDVTVPDLKRFLRSMAGALDFLAALHPHRTNKSARSGVKLSELISQRGKRRAKTE